MLTNNPLGNNYNDVNPKVRLTDDALNWMDNKLIYYDLRNIYVKWNDQDCKCIA
jgi:hypothetical protein